MVEFIGGKSLVKVVVVVDVVVHTMVEVVEKIVMKMAFGGCEGERKWW